LPYSRFLCPPVGLQLFCKCNVVWVVPAPHTNIEDSLPARSRATATAQTRIAAPVTMPTFTKATAKNMARLLSLSSRASSAAAPVVERLLPPGLLRLPLAPATHRLPLLHPAATVPRSGDSAVAKGKWIKFMLLFASADEISRWTGPTCCQSGSTCKASNQYYSQCQ
jgi:hypothetical protein